MEIFLIRIPMWQTSSGVNRNILSTTRERMDHNDHNLQTVHKSKCFNYSYRYLQVKSYGRFQDQRISRGLQYSLYLYPYFEKF